MKFTRNKLIIGLMLLLLLGASFWYGGNAPGLRGWQANESLEESFVKVEEDIKIKEEVEDEEVEEEDIKEIEEDIEEDLVEKKEEIRQEDESYSKEKAMEIDPKTKKDKYKTDPVPEGKPIPVEAENSEKTNTKKYCTLSVECTSILNNMEWLNPDKVELIPEDGIIYARKKVEFYQGESVFNVLLREMKKEKIHMEFKNTPAYNSSYVEAINNLYEFDCGELSGWMYKVNDWFPNYGSSRYALEDGDQIEWHYTCDLGRDVKGSSSIGGQ